jgi:hypothetical protein
MATYRYEIEFADDGSGQSFIAERIYNEEMDWQDIWQDIVSSGDLQMTYELVETIEDEEE